MTSFCKPQFLSAVRWIIFFHVTFTFWPYDLGLKFDTFLNSCLSYKACLLNLEGR